MKIQAIRIFRYWQQHGVKALKNQRITKWRPNKGVVLLTTKEDLQKLAWNIPKEDKLPQGYTVLFESETVLRLFLQ